MKQKLMIGLLAAFVAMALAWNVILPPYENLDEIEHTEVVRYVATTGQLPIHGAAQAAGFAVRQEASQPPLYYLLSAVWVRLWGLPLETPTAHPVPGAVVACGSSESFYNKVTWTPRPYPNDFPWSGHVRLLHGLRLFSTLLQVATVVGTWTLARRLFPRGPVAPLATVIVAFNPQFLMVAAGVNNDNLVTPLATWGTVLALTLWQRGPTVQRLLLFSVLAGLAALSKLSGLALLGLGGLVMLAWAWRARIPFVQLVGWGVLLAFPAALLLAPWLLRNLRLYGDMTALTPMLTRVGYRTSAIGWGELSLMFRSYWGQAACSFYPRAFYGPYLLLTLGGLSGLALRWRRLTAAQQWNCGWLGLWFVLVVVAWWRWNLITPAPGGRLLFPAAPALAVLLAAGWNGWGRTGVRWWAVGLLGWTLVAVRAGPLLLFAPPRLLPAVQSVPNPVDYTFGEGLRLRGYTARIVAPRLWCWLAAESYCGYALETTLYWQLEQAQPEDWRLALQLPSARPGDTTLRFSYDRWPGGGKLPTSAWPVGPLIADHYLLPLSAADFPTQAWDLQVAWVDPANEERLPVHGGSTPLGDAVRLATLRVPGRAAACPVGETLTPASHFGNAVALSQAAVTQTGDTWEVTLCWQSLAPLPTDYTVFVHAYNAEGTLLATGDGPPMENAFPSRLWQPGDQIVDRHTLTLPAGSRPAQVAVGLYDPQTLARLPATQAGQPLPNEAAIIWQP